MRQVTLSEGEYMDPEEQIIRCKKCKAPREKVLDYFGKVSYGGVLCLCEIEKRQEEERRRKEEEHSRKIRKYKEDGLGWKSLWDCSFDNLIGKKEHFVKLIRNYTDDYSNQTSGLLLWGPPGRGKTYSAACVVNQLIEDQHPAVMVSFRQLISELAGIPIQERSEKLQRLFQKELICLDDLEVRHLSKFSEELAVEIADHIERCPSPIIITTGYTMREMENPKNDLEKYIFRKILGRVRPVLVDGEDIREQEKQKALQQMKRDLEGDYTKIKPITHKTSRRTSRKGEASYGYGGEASEGDRAADQTIGEDGPGDQTV